MNSPQTKHRGMTLVEMLTVIGIIALAAAFALPSIIETRRSSALTQAAQLLSDQFIRARQAAIAKNRSVYVVFLQTDELGAPGTLWRAFQLCRPMVSDLYDPDPAAFKIEPEERMIQFPPSIIFNTSSDLSTLLTESTATAWQSSRGTFPSSRVLEFRPDGSVYVQQPSVNGAVPPAPARWTLTLTAQSDAASSTPNNFATLVLDSRTGRAKLFRP